LSSCGGRHESTAKSVAHISMFTNITTLWLKFSIAVLHYQMSRTERERDKKM
jgi:hypothetical protein